MGTSLNYDDMSSVEIDGEEPFPFLMMASTFEQVKKVTDTSKSALRR